MIFTSGANEPQPLKSVDEHNETKRLLKMMREEAMTKTGVACPKCGDELKWESVYCQTAQYPPSTTAPANCKKCGLAIRLEK